MISTGVRISCYTIGEKGKKSVALATHGNNDMRENISNVFGPKQVSFDLDQGPVVQSWVSLTLGSDSSPVVI